MLIKCVTYVNILLSQTELNDVMPKTQNEIWKICDCHTAHSIASHSWLSYPMGESVFVVIVMSLPTGVTLCVCASSYQLPFLSWNTISRKRSKKKAKLDKTDTEKFFIFSQFYLIVEQEINLHVESETGWFLLVSRLLQDKIYWINIFLFLK